jgi:hypothetical protein
MHLARTRPRSAGAMPDPKKSMQKLESELSFSNLKHAYLAVPRQRGRAQPAHRRHDRQQIRQHLGGQHPAHEHDALSALHPLLLPGHSPRLLPSILVVDHLRAGNPGGLFFGGTFLLPVLLSILPSFKSSSSLSRPFKRRGLILLSRPS